MRLTLLGEVLVEVLLRSETREEGLGGDMLNFLVGFHCGTVGVGRLFEFEFKVGGMLCLVLIIRVKLSLTEII